MAAQINAKDDRTAPTKKAFDQGGPVWPPRSNAMHSRSGGGFDPPAKYRGISRLGGGAPQPRNEKNTLIEAAPFGHLDQMLRTTEQRRKEKHLIKAALFGRLDQFDKC